MHSSETAVSSFGCPNVKVDPAFSSAASKLFHRKLLDLFPLIPVLCFDMKHHTLIGKHECIQCNWHCHLEAVHIKLPLKLTHIWPEKSWKLFDLCPLFRPLLVLSGTWLCARPTRHHWGKQVLFHDWWTCCSSLTRTHRDTPPQHSRHIRFGACFDNVRYL